MSKFVEILAMVLGGLSLFTVSFVGFCALTGRPLGDVPGLGLVLSPAESQEPQPSPAPAEPRPMTGHDERAEVVHSSIGMMGAWSLPSPYTQVELKALTDELKAKLLDLEQRELAVTEREHEAEAQAQSARERFDVLDQMRLSLDAFEQELELREQEILAAERSMTTLEREMWSDRAAVIGAMEPPRAAVRLVDYSPEEAAKILRSMDGEQASEILNSIQDGRWREFVDAYAREHSLPERP